MKLLLFLLFNCHFLYSLQIKIRDKLLDVEVANCEKTRQKGLQSRNILEDSHGMLFIFPTSILASFWMKDTYIDLSIGFFDENKKLIQIEKMPSFKIGQPLHLYQSQKPIKYALEVNIDWFEKNNIKVGDIFYID